MSRVEIQPELWVPDSAAAVAFYTRAFGAVVEHRVGEPDDPNGVAQLSVDGARFWISSTSDELGRLSPEAIGGATARYLLVVDEPEDVVGAAVAAGAIEMSPVADEHGWRLGRIKDPFGHEWEIGRPLGRWPPES
jgi:PhnB protein